MLLPLLSLLRHMRLPANLSANCRENRENHENYEKREKAVKNSNLRLLTAFDHKNNRSPVQTAA